MSDQEDTQVESEEGAADVQMRSGVLVERSYDSAGGIDFNVSGIGDCEPAAWPTILRLAANRIERNLGL